MLTSAPTIFFWTATLLHPVLGCGRGPAFLLRATTPSTPTADSTQPASTPSKHGSTSPQAPTSTPDPNDRGASNRSGALEAEVPLWVRQAQGPFAPSAGTAFGRPGWGPLTGQSGDDPSKQKENLYHTARLGHLDRFCEYSVRDQSPAPLMEQRQLRRFASATVVVTGGGATRGRSAGC